MIASLRGRLIYKDSQEAVVECSGVGYAVAMPSPSLSALGSEGDNVFVLVYTHVAEDALRLFGFLEAGDRLAFTVLMNTTGVGPKLALAILSALNHSQLAAVVERGDKRALTTISGVGAKKAERLLIDLKGRLQSEGATLPTMGSSGAKTIMSDLVSALINLGFATSVAEAAASHAVDTRPESTDIALLVREALQVTVRR